MHYITSFAAENGVRIQFGMIVSIVDVLAKFFSRKGFSFIENSSDNQEHRQHKATILFFIIFIV